MAVTRQNDVRMNIVGQQDQIVAAGNLQNPAQLLFPPHSTHRIMGRAQQQNFRLRRQCLQLIEINRVAAWTCHQWVEQQAPPRVGDSSKEGKVHRRLHDHTLPVIRQSQAGGVQRGHHARHHQNPVALDGPAVAPLEPVDH